MLINRAFHGDSEALDLQRSQVEASAASEEGKDGSGDGCMVIVLFVLSGGYIPTSMNFKSLLRFDEMYVYMTKEWNGEREPPPPFWMGVFER